MAHTEKELELEGHTLPTQELLAEAERLLGVARTHAMAIRTEGIEQKHITEADQVCEMVGKEHARVEALPPKIFSPNREQDRLIQRALQWRAVMVRRADRAFADDRHARLRYHRGFQLQKTPERLYEELYLLIQLARADIKRVPIPGVDEAFLLKGEDLLYELQGRAVPNRQADDEYRKRLKEHKYGPPPKAPEAIQPLPAVNDSAKHISVQKGRLYLLIRTISAAGMAAFSQPKEREAQRAAQARRDFVIRIRPQEDDEDLMNLGTPVTAVTADEPAQPPLAESTNPPEPATTRNVLPMDKVTSKPGGPNPLPPSDPLKKPPPRAVGLVRPSPVVGNKGDKT